MNRNARRALKRDALGMAEKLAISCLDFHGGALVKVTDPKAIAALRRAFRRCRNQPGELARDGPNLSSPCPACGPKSGLSAPFEKQSRKSNARP